MFHFGTENQEERLKKNTRIMKKRRRKDQKKYRQPLLWKANRYRRQQTWKVSVEQAEIASFMEMRELDAKSQLEF